MEAFLDEIESKEVTGEVRHIPKGRGNLGDSAMAFGEIVREQLIGKCMFDLVSIGVRNFVIDQILAAESPERDLNQLHFIMAHVICIALTFKNQVGGGQRQERGLIQLLLFESSIGF